MNPHQWYVTKQSFFNVQKPRWSRKGWCNKPTKLQILSILILKILMLSNATNHRIRPKNMATCALGDSLVHQQWHSPSSWKYLKRLLLRWLHHFKTDLINNIDYMRILGNEPSSVIPSQTSCFKSWNDFPKVQKPRWSQKGCVINPWTYTFYQF